MQHYYYIHALVNFESSFKFLYFIFLVELIGFLLYSKMFTAISGPIIHKKSIKIRIF
jgi:hypothetical protein